MENEENVEEVNNNEELTEDAKNAMSRLIELEDTEEEAIDPKDMLNALLDKQTSILSDTIKAVVDIIKTNPELMLKMAIGEIHLDTTEREPSKISISFGTLAITIDDSSTTADQKLDKIYGFIEKLNTLGMRPDHMIVPVELPGEVMDDEEAVNSIYG